MPGQAKILIVDDEAAIRLSLGRALSLEGYYVVEAANGEEALARLEETVFDLLLVDLRMPGIDGLQVMKEAKKLSPATVVIMLTAYGTIESAVSALRQGAHDYLLKPCSIETVLASVSKGLAKRHQQLCRGKLAAQIEASAHELLAEESPLSTTSPTPETGRAWPKEVLQVGPLAIDRQKHLATLHGQPLGLTPTELRLLSCLMSNADQLMSAQELVKRVQNYECSEAEAQAIIRVHIHRLRQKVEPDPSNPRYIHNVRGKGYILVAESGDEEQMDH